MQDFEILTGANSQLSVTMHGSTCGQSGAEVCNAILEWDGRTFAPAQRRAEGSAVTPSITEIWSVQPDGSGILTARTGQGPAPLRDIGVSCHDGRPLLAIRPDNRLGGSVTLAVAADGRTAQMLLRLDPRTGIYFGLPASPPILMLLAGGADQAEISVNGWRAGVVALQGAPTALAEALAPCWRGEDLAAGAARQP